MTTAAGAVAVQFDPVEHRYFALPDGGELYSVTTVLRLAGFLDPSRYTEFARQRGTLVHEMIEWAVSGTLDESTLDPRLVPYLDGFRQFQADEDGVCHHVEHRLGDLTRTLAGTVDWIGTVRGKPAIVDYKTGEPEPWHRVQIALYATLAEVHGLVPLARRVQRFGLYLTARGGYHLIPYTDRDDFDHGEAARVAALWRLRYGYRNDFPVA